MKKWLIRARNILGIILLIWLLLTVFIQLYDANIQADFGDKNADQTALIVFHPDAFYNLDEQLCRAMAEQLALSGWFVQLRSISASKPNHRLTSYDLVITCANTYNWAPDWKTSSWIARSISSGQNSVALTIGSGSTQRSHRLHLTQLRQSGAQVLADGEIWLMKPNDSKKMDQSNIITAKERAVHLIRIAVSQISG